MKLSSIWELKKIALRNLARHKVKTVLTSLAIMVSVAVYIFLNSWLGGMAIESRRNIINFEQGAARLQTNLYFERKDEMPSYENFKNWEIYKEALDNEGYVSTPRFTFTGTLFSSSGSAPIMFFGIDPDAEKQVLRYADYVDFGCFVQNGNFEIVLGTIAAEKLKVGIPSRPYRKELEELISITAATYEEEEFIRSLYDVTLVTKDPFGINVDFKSVEGNERMVLKRSASKSDLDRYWKMIEATGRNNVRVNAFIEIKDSLDASDKVYRINQTMDLSVVGVINSPAPLPNGNTAFLPLDILQDESGMMLEGAVTELIIREKGVPDSRLPGKSESSLVITDALKRGLAAMGLSMPEELGVHTWQDYMEDYLSYEAIQTGMPQVLAFLLLLLSFLGISNTILLAIIERTKEIGMMRAMGMTDGQMVMTYMLEAGFLGLMGSVLGIIVGCIINYPIVKYGIDFTAMGDLMPDGIGFRTTAVFRSSWNVAVIFGSGIIATLLSSLVAILPTRRAVKKPITESLRFE